jgi:hypothetical protein
VRARTKPKKKPWNVKQTIQEFGGTPYVLFVVDNGIAELVPLRATPSPPPKKSLKTQTNNLGLLPWPMRDSAVVGDLGICRSESSLLVAGSAWSKTTSWEVACPVVSAMQVHRSLCCSCTGVSRCTWQPKGGLVRLSDGPVGRDDTVCNKGLDYCII